MSNNLDYIQELGIGSDDATQSDAETNDTGDIVQDSSTEESEVSTGGNTEPDISVELRKQIEGLEKRISDKDEYINTLREQSKAREEDSYGDDEDTNQVDDFWENPEKVIQDMKETMRIQQMQIVEAQYANTVENYWKTVNQKDLQEAVALDPEFSKQFNDSNEPFRVAYEYLSKKTSSKAEEQSALEQSIRDKILKEMGLDKPKKDGMPNMGKMGGSAGTKADANEDGFAAVFGQ